MIAKTKTEPNAAVRRRLRVLDKGDAPLAVRPERAAVMLDLSRETIYTLLNRGDLKSVNVGSARLIPVSSIRALLDG